MNYKNAESMKILHSTDWKWFKYTGTLSVLLKQCCIQKTEVIANCSFSKKLEKSFWKSSLLIVTFHVPFQGFNLDFKLSLLLHFRFPRAYIFQNNSFLLVQGGRPKYYMKTD